MLTCGEKKKEGKFYVDWIIIFSFFFFFDANRVKLGINLGKMREFNTTWCVSP